MNFVKNENNFPSEVHKVIYQIGLYRTPLETSLANTENIHESLINSCKSYFAFMTDLLSDMYENPSEYNLNGKKTKNQIERIINPLLDMGRLCSINEDEIEIPMQYYKYITQSLQAFKRQGLDFYTNNNTIFVVSPKYPDMFLAMSELAKSVKNVKKFGRQNFYTCEFRQIFSDYHPQYEDIVAPLNDKMREIADEIDRYAISLNMKRCYINYWNVHYKLKGINCFCIGTNHINKFGIRILNWDKGNNGSYLLKNVEQQNDAFKKYFFRHLNYCRACSKSHIGQIVNVLGKNKRLCGGVPHVGFSNPTNDDIPYIKKFIDFKYDYIIDKVKK